MNDNTTFGDMINTGIDTVIDQMKRHVNLPPETEELIEEALHQAAQYGVEYAQKLAQALRERVHEDAA
jgi:tartrate dehydratase alpha subunit/fumarate hydratase class I-like protein